MKVQKKLLHRHAYDVDGKLVLVKNAEKEKTYFCGDPECKNEIIFRNSGKTGRGSRRPHFSHKKGTNPNCSPDRALHEGFKKELYRYLEKHREENKQFLFSWKCGTCGFLNTGNLLAKVAQIRCEHDLGECQPDIALMDKDGRVLVVIEIVNTHAPEEHALQCYKRNQITLIQINLFSDEDIERIEEKASNPDIVDLCLSSGCQSNYKDKFDRRIVYNFYPCGRCHSHLARFQIQIETVFGVQSTLGFTDDELNLVRSNTPYIQIKSERTSQEMKVKYPVQECVNCKKMNSMFRRGGRL